MSFWWNTIEAVVNGGLWEVGGKVEDINGVEDTRWEEGRMDDVEDIAYVAWHNMMW